ncbi:MAG TPA: pyridoxal-phosphate dependent enzyme [Polyangiaceae bacterium LLY-WYZ-15_(1-7)]|nr:1-aminocyclopropane-1-carboxylate deaminase [Myxococcales bacterium]MAT24636.1 1-aminocyclopropane-1-carboxylate deaminase [Sandaracinus sp.]HJK95006.1 pyridoxal-phosphate dependent enzyme [Polyangiaceae bacterium LLY-WYZ-15_(1-7)]HJL05986.1 pyridoxal-phosphate dependent enzyme [Polyangiaceae bacterium LLY-WYZ-15_(1-7)]HJL13488.1 pyridoxal-phosphate dependent enzyme [Polyangiaceae bacterium LLY-WYZ-15_(1-7)]
MSLLARRFPKLSMVPHVPLARTTPVERMDDLSKALGAELWVKRDDRTADLYGGNKVRKLGFLLGDARQKGCEALVTAGALGSHHVLATSLFGRKWGFDVHAVMVPQPWTGHVEENLRADLAVGATLHPVKAWAAVPPTMAGLAAHMRLQGKRTYRVAYGGSSPVGALGYVEAGLELAAQIEAGELPEPERIFVALGSGGTAAGLAIGLASLGITTKVHAVRVTPRLVCNQATVAALITATMRKLRKVEPAFPAVAPAARAAVEIDHSLFGGGYGTLDDATREATVRADAEGLSVDPTYTAKAFAALLRHQRATPGRALFWHTLSSADLSPVLEDAPEAPAWARQLAR